MSKINPQTVEELLELPDLVANMSDEQLERHLVKYFPHTRPLSPVNATSVHLDKITISTGKSAMDLLEERIRLKNKK